MDYTNIFVILFVSGTLIEFALNFTLNLLAYLNRRKYGTEVPEELADVMDAQKVRETAAYKNAEYFLWLPKGILNEALTLCLVLGGFYRWLYMLLWDWTGNMYITVILFVFFASIPGELLSLPFDLWHEFKIEKKFGFSKMTLGLWVSDAVKDFLLNAAIDVPLLCAAVFLLIHAASWWWLLLSAVYLAFIFLVAYIYPAVVAPMFNKFTPLEDGELKDRVVSLLDRCGFKAKSVFVMDASKRSGHSNAYFTGIGRNKRIVLFDTLIDVFDPPEIEAILAHELGHYRHRHMLKRYCIMGPLVFVALFAASLFIGMSSLYSGFGVSLELLQNGVPVYLSFFGLYMLSVIFTQWSWPVRLISNTVSRRNEFQADAFSAKMCGTADPLITALAILNRENLSELKPSRLYYVFKYSHPPVLYRISALLKLEQSGSLNRQDETN